MEKININVKDVDNTEIINLVKSNDELNKVITELNITHKEIVDNFEFFLTFLNYNKHCANCRGMDYCRQKNLGHIYNIKRNDIDNTLTDCYSICSYYTKYYQRKENLLCTTFEEKDLLNGSQSNFLYDNANLLGKDFFMKITSLLQGNYVSGAYVRLKDAHVRLKLMQSLAFGLLWTKKVSIVKFSDLLKKFKNEFGVKYEDSTLYQIEKCDVLIIDGLGNESITSWSRDEVLFSILDNRLQARLTTILCSEYSTDDLKRAYSLSKYKEDIKANQLIEKIKAITN